MHKLGGVLSISTKEEFENVWKKLTDSNKTRIEMGKTNFDFIRKGIGTSDKLIFYLRQDLI